MNKSIQTSMFTAVVVGVLGLTTMVGPASNAYAAPARAQQVAQAGDRVDRRVDRRAERPNVQNNRQDIRQDVRQDIRADRRAFYAARPYGHRVTMLPAARTRLHVHGASYYYHSGVFYSYRAGDYVVVRAPYGARIRVLPAGYHAFHLGAHRYFYVNSTYYIYDAAKIEYVVVKAPAGADTAMTKASEDVSEELFVYPADGQTEADVDRDRYECHRWAVDQSDYNPSMPSTSSDKSAEYTRAEMACLEGRGYSVN